MTSDPTAPLKFNHQVLRLLERLGYRADADFIDDPTKLAMSQTSHAVRTAFARMNVVGAFCPLSSLAAGTRRQVPVLYVAVAENGEEDAIHRSIWSQSVVPLLLIATSAGFEIRNGFDYRGRSNIWPWHFLDHDQLPDALVSLTPAALRSATAWRDFHMPTRVDERLGKAVRELSNDIAAGNAELAGRRDVVNAAIGRFLYFYVLVDRGIIDQEWVDSLNIGTRQACPSITLREGFAPDDSKPAVWPAAEVWRLFDSVDQVLNGSLFPLTLRERKLLNADTLHLIRRALRSDTLEAGTQQYGFLDVDYAAIRTETISALYECFFELETGDSKRAEGAFYTPPFLVDYIVDEVDSASPLQVGSLIIDPACGSGAFLVAGFRRIVERMRTNRVPLQAGNLHDALSSTLMGFEIKRQATNVARFSLYLTMLDYLPELKLRNARRLMDGRRLFPDLTRRVMHRDAFSPLPRSAQRKATHVLTNPPWTKVPDGSPAARYREALIRRLMDCPPLAATAGMAETFYWRAIRDICAPDGRVAMVLPTKSFISPSATVFPSALASTSRVSGFTNLAHFRERLFASSREAATVVFAAPGAPNPLDWTWRYSPKVSSQPVGRDGVPWAIIVDRGQVEKFRQGDLLLPDHEWFRDFMLQPLDRQLARLLVQHGNGARSIGSFMDAAGIKVVRGGSPLETNIPPRLLLNTKTENFRRRLGILPGSIRSYILDNNTLRSAARPYRQAFQGPMLLMPRSQADAHLVDHSAAFSSSLLGIHFTSDEFPRESQLSVLGELGKYPRTSVGRYLLALFGRLWVFDQRRFESKDLLRLPFPYRDVDDLLENPVTSFRNDAAFTAFCCARFEIGNLFELAVVEHHALREQYQDGRRPAAGALATTPKQRREYKSVIIGELRTLFRDLPLRLQFTEDSAPGTKAFRIVMGAGTEQPYGETSTPAGLAEEVSIFLTEREGQAVALFVKPDMRSAWTAERAYADAILTARRIFSA